MVKGSNVQLRHSMYDRMLYAPKGNHRVPTICRLLTQTRQVVFEHLARMAAVCQSLVDRRPSYFYIKCTQQPPSNS